MMSIYQEQLPNGLWLLGQPIEGAQSLSMTLLTPAGLCAEPADRQGLATLLSEMICRGAGGLSAREHCDALDALGVMRHTSVDTYHLHLGATLIGLKSRQALPLLLDMVLRPNLEPQAFEPSRALALQALDALADEPQQRVMIDLKRAHFPEPLNRSPLGQRPHIQAARVEEVQQFWQQHVKPQGSILAFAGHLDWPALRQQVQELTADWAGEPQPPVPPAAPSRGYHPVHADTAQMHIGLAYDAAPETDEARSLLQRLAAAVLSGGMSGRLFTQVREKRGLCYAVYAGYAGQKDRGAMLAYAGTTPPRAQETLDVLVQELRRLGEGVENDEFQRAVVGMKSRLVMQGESTSARAAALARDQYLLGRPRSLDELASRIDAISLPQLNDFLRLHPPGPMTVVTVGPQKLKIPNHG
ncbi:MAG TPA: pitrilysin family protein [Phycisphaeraceae bacterium]